jgi:hypothetical protein
MFSNLAAILGIHISDSALSSTDELAMFNRIGEVRLTFYFFFVMQQHIGAANHLAPQNCDANIKHAKS